jgi:hypothetical protein
MTGYDDPPRFRCERHGWEDDDVPCDYCEADQEWAELLKAREYAEDAPVPLCPHAINLSRAACGRCLNL